MQTAPSTQSAANRLRALKSRFTKQERFMSHALRDLREQLEGCNGQASKEPPKGTSKELQQATTDLSVELTHVRMAIAGADEELTSCITYQHLGA
jgi:hypothetical protein